MGLDMTAFKTKSTPEEIQLAKELANSGVEVTPIQTEELHDWRKHPDLHGLMEEIWKEKGGTGEFNCEDVNLNLQDLERIEERVKARSLPKTSGFFFGISENNDWELKDDLDFIRKAKEAINEGYQVFYTSWW